MFVVTVYYDMTDTSDADRNAYCGCEFLCSCQNDIVIGGVVFSVHRDPTHQYIDGRFITCDDLDCATCLDSLPF